MYINLALVIVSIILICVSSFNYINAKKVKDLLELIDRINHELQGVEGRLPHDTYRIVRALKLTNGEKID